jgi:hypothetical protein
MTATTRTGPSAAFRDLRRALARRRLRRADARLRFVVLALVLVLSAFTYWRVRVPLDGVHRFHGASGAALMLGAVLGAFVLAGGVLAASRQGSMRRGTPGPEWLALPAPPGLVSRHMAEEAALPSLAVLPPAAAALLAGAGLVPPLALALLGLAFALAWRLAARAACALVRSAAIPSRPAERALPRETRWLVAEPRRLEARRGPAPAWRRASPAAALARLDALATRRASPSRARFAAALLAGLAGVLVWFDGAEPMLRRAQAFVFLMPAAASLGAWALHRACAEPANLHRPLPLSLRDAWLARAVPVALVLLALTAAGTAASAGLPVAARLAIVPAWWPTAFAVAILGLHYGLTLVPHADAAEMVYACWLGAAITASLMVPLLGWFVLVAGLVHSGLRLRRWWTPEVPL